VLWIRITLMRIRIRLNTLMRIRIVFYADADPTFHPDTGPDPDPDPYFPIKAQTLEKVLK
jgi:hypothetical protein